MRIIIDGDACPNKEEIKQLAQKYQLEMLVFIDYAHELSDDYYQVILCDIDQDSVDLKILKEAKKNDIVITQDYGLASLLIAKKVKVLHISGKEINDFNIDGLLMSRYQNAKLRKMNGRCKGPSKRTKEVKLYFLKQLEQMLQNNTCDTIN